MKLLFLTIVLTLTFVQSAFAYEVDGGSYGLSCRYAYGWYYWHEWDYVSKSYQPVYPMIPCA